MSLVVKNFLDRNEGFACLQCGRTNKPQEKSCRNHCISCLFSRHMDEDVPGDRKSKCQGLMKPVALEYSSQKGQIIVHECEGCKKSMRNKVAPDDEQESLRILSLQIW